MQLQQQISKLPALNIVVKGEISSLHKPASDLRQNLFQDEKRGITRKKKRSPRHKIFPVKSDKCTQPDRLYPD